MKKAIIGYGGHAKEVMFQMKTELPCFVEDRFCTVGALPLSDFNPSKYEVLVCVGDSVARKHLVNKLPVNTNYFTFIHSTAIVGKDVHLGKGAFIGAYSVITTNVKIGCHALLNRHCQIGHDTTIGDFLSMMPNSVISGNCVVGDNVYFGTNSSTKEKVKVCSNVILGLNSGVVKNIVETGIYVGIPAKKIKPLQPLV